MACGGGAPDAGAPPGTITGRDTAITVVEPAEPCREPASVRLLLSAPGVGFDDPPPGLPYSGVSGTSPDSGFVGNEGGVSGPWYGIAYFAVRDGSGALDAFRTRRAVTSNTRGIAGFAFGGRTSASLGLHDGVELQVLGTDFIATGEDGDRFTGRMMAFEANGFVVVAFALALPAEASGAFERLEKLVESAHILEPGRPCSAEYAY